MKKASVSSSKLKTQSSFVKRKQPTFLRGRVTTEHYDDIINRTFEHNTTSKKKRP